MTFLAAALDYAGRGWPVFPCSPDTKAPLVPKESKPGARDGGLYLATVEEEQVRQWWKRWPKALIGVPTGAKIGAFVIDLDPREHSADDMLAGLRDWLGEALPPCPVSRTQSGGLHLFFAMPQLAEAAKLGNRANLFGKVEAVPAAIASHVDVRGDGGYVIVAPSVMASGAVYAWEQEPDETGFPAAPEQLLDVVLKRVKPNEKSDIGIPISERAYRPSRNDHLDAVDKARHRYAMAALDREIGELSRAAEGERGSTLNKVAFSLGGLVGAGMLSETLLRAELWGACERNGLMAKDGAEKVRGNIARSIDQGKAKPLDASQIGQRAGTSRKTSRAARPPDDGPPRTSSSSKPPAPSGEASGSDDPSRDEAPEDVAEGGRGRRYEQLGWEGRFGEVDLFCAGLPATDLGNAQRFVKRFGGDFVYVEQWGWLGWDGKRWNAHEADAILSRAVHATIKAIGDEASALRINNEQFTPATRRDREDHFREFGIGTKFIDPCVERSDKKGAIFASDRLTGWCTASQSNAHISCVARLAQAYLTASPDSFDADVAAFNVDNGTLRFSKEIEGYVSFAPHDRRDRMTKITPVAYDPQAKCDVYDKFLARVQPDQAMQRHLHAWGGVSLTARPLAKLAFWYGTGRNGKSTLIDIWAHVMGDYAQTIPIESFLDQGRSRRGGEASPDIASLPGVRCLRTSEPEKGAQLAEGLVKLITGGEPMRARHLNRDFFEFRPSFKLTMQGNYKPQIRGTDEGLWARMLLVPWMVMIPEAERDAALPDKLKAEAPGVLNRLLDGLRDFLDHGLNPPAEVLDATAAYREDSDPVGQFITECTARVPPIMGEAGRKIEERVPGKTIYSCYIAWAKAYGEKPWSPKAFARGLQDHGIRRLKSSGIYYLDIRMTKLAADFSGQEMEADPHDD